MDASLADPLFIIGLPRSGTSWLAAALGNLPGVKSFHEGLGGCNSDADYFQKLGKHDKAVDCDPGLLLYPDILHQIITAGCNVITIHRSLSFAKDAMKSAMHEAGSAYSNQDMIKVLDRMDEMSERLEQLEERAVLNLEFHELFNSDPLLQIAYHLGFQVQTPELEEWAEWWPNYRVTQDMARVAEGEIVYP